MNMTDDSSCTSDIDIDRRFVKLQRNHRRLLGVTSALTEALEYTVRGDDFDLEETLNECMRIYPELFVHQNVYYAGNVRYDTSDNITENSTIRHNTFETKPKYFKNVPEIPRIYVRSESETSEIQNNVSGRFSKQGVPSNTKTTTGVPFQEQETKNKNYPGGKASFLILSPEYRQESFSFESKSNKSNDLRINNNNNNLTKAQDNHSETHDTVVDENSYEVKHPDSDTDFARKKVTTPEVTIKCLDPNDNKIEEVIIGEASSSKTILNKHYGPYEIIVRPGSETIDRNLSIQIKPEGSSESFKSNTFQTKPLETCIIITKHVETQSDFDSVIEVTSQNKPGTSVNMVNSIEKKPLNTMDMLQKLSTGLKVHSHDIVPDYLVEESPTRKKIQHSQFGSQTTVPQLLAEKPEFSSSTNDNSKDHYLKLRSTLIEGSVKDKVLIIQRLRLNLIHTLAKERAELLASYTENDVLDIKNEKSNVSILENVLPNEIVNGWDLILQQVVLKFLNTVCSMWKGRDYLTINTKIITCLLNSFFEKHKSQTDTISQDMLSAIIHKLSTRQNQLAILFSSGVVEKIFYNLLEAYNSMTIYRLRHSLGILINACTFSNGRNVMEHMAADIFNLLITLLKSNDKKIIPYAARLIYVLMANEVFHKKSKEIDLISTLEKSTNTSNKRLKLQFDILKTVIEQPKPHEYLCGTEENFLANIEAEMDELEEEVELGEPVLSDSRTDCHDNIQIKSNQSKNEPEETNAPNSKVHTTKKSNLPKYLQRKPNPINNKTPNAQTSSKIKTEPEKPTIIKTKKPQVNQKKTIKRESTLKRQKTVDTPKIIKPKIVKRHEIVESPDDSKSYIILDDGKNKPTEVQQVNDEENPRTTNDQSVSYTCMRAQIDNEASFVILDGSESNQSSATSTDINVNQDHMQLPSDILKSDEMLNTTAAYDDGMFLNPDVSLFIQRGKVSEIEYDYCEDTKEIMSPIKRGGSVFKGQSPYKALLIDNQKPTVFVQPAVQIDKISTDDTSDDNKETKV